MRIERIDPIEFAKHYTRLSRLLGCSPNYGFSNGHLEAGSFSARENRISINPENVRFKSDLPFALAHEMRHAWQWKHGLVGSSEVDVSSYIAYLLSETEQDANGFALRYIRKYANWKPPAITQSMVKAGAYKLKERDKFEDILGTHDWVKRHYSEASMTLIYYRVLGLERGPKIQWARDLP